MNHNALKKTGLRFKTKEAAERWLYHGDASGAIKKGQSGYRKARYEANLACDKK